MLPKDEIDLYSIITEHVNLINKIRQLLNVHVSPLMEKAHRFLAQLSAEAKSVNPLGSPCVFIKWNETNERISFTLELLPQYRIQESGNTPSQ